MREYRRYAVYFAPASGSALARFGAQWLGRDSEAGETLQRPWIARRPLALDAATAAPRRYGFHATFKAPFRLADGEDAAALAAAAEAVAGDHTAFAVPLRVAALGQFLALVPVGESAPLAALAADCVVRLDRFRAPPSEAELGRRRESGLTAGEETHLLRWGYPYVLDRFQFHLTLTGPLSAGDQAAVAEVLVGTLAPLLLAPVPFADIALFGEAEDGLFHLIRRFFLAEPMRR